MSLIATIVGKTKELLFTAHVKMSAKSYGKNLMVTEFTQVNSKTVIGDNVHLNGVKIKGYGPCSIGDNFTNGIECVIHTSNHRWKDAKKLPFDERNDLGPVKIDRNVWFGTRVMVLPGVTIGEGAIIQAGSVIYQDVPPLSIVSTHSQKVIGQRDKAHYDKLTK
jgi:chloramphenicol O-acetyltransferase type B